MRNAYCYRSIVAELGAIPSAACALVTNAVFATLIFLTFRQILEETLSFTSFKVRISLMQLRTKDQLLAMNAAQRDTLDKAHHPALFVNPSMLMVMMSNWAMSKLFKVNFATTVLSESMLAEKRKKS
jgi:hypothetical protein